MDHPRTDRLEFRQYSEDEKHLFVGLVTDPAVMRFVGDGPLTNEAAESLWKKLTEEFYTDGKTTIWALFAATDGEFIGHASLRPRPEYPDEWEIGYILKKKVWGLGFATEAAKELVRYGFAELALRVVFATVDEENDTSIRVLKKAGLQFVRYDHDEQGRYMVFSTLRNGFVDKGEPEHC